MSDTPARARVVRRAMSLRGLRELMVTLLVAFVAAYGLRVFVYEPFNVPSSSMLPALMPGDYVLAAKWPYGYSRVSPAPVVLPGPAGRLGGAPPERGDVVVFKNGQDAGRHYVKRVIAVGGDTVRLRGGTILLNGAPLARTPLGPGEAGLNARGLSVTITAYREEIAPGRSYTVLEQTNRTGAAIGLDDTYEYIVPQGAVFVMGDNRDDSIDSRWPGRVGYVPLESIVGRVGFVFVSAGPQFRALDPATWGAWRSERAFLEVEGR